MPKVVHMTSVHSPLDPRILQKECRSLAQAGYQVTLIAPADEGANLDGVRLVPVPKAKSRLTRMLCTAASVFHAAVRERAHIYHFHDPELIPWGLALRLLGRHVIFDVHEDYLSAIEQKRYLTPLARQLVGAAWRRIEQLAASAFHIVLAEKYYRERLPHGHIVLNYPLASEISGQISAFDARSRRLLYTGNVTEDRGALAHARIPALVDDLEVHLVGRCSRELSERMYAEAAGAAGRLHLVGIDEYIPFSRIRSCYTEERWLCGLAIFPPTPHYVRKELTKFFEYMQAGLPIVCSNFPIWRELIESHGVGLCVDPNDPKAIVDAVQWIASHPQQAAEMGARGQLLVQKNFTWDSQARELVRMYGEILGAQGSHTT